MTITMNGLLVEPSRYKELTDVGLCAYKTSCPDCHSSDANQVYTYASKANDSYCFACSTYHPSDTNIADNKSNYKADVMNDLEQIKALPILSIPDRKIRKETASTYRVRASVSQEDGTTITHLYSPDTLGGKLVGYESKDVKSKRFTSIGDRKGDLDLWGSWTCTGGLKLFITEGRLDALSLHQVIKDNTAEKYKQYKPNVVSLTRGAAGAVKDLLNNKELLSKYKEVVLVFDNDDAGNKATKDCLKVFPLFKTVSLSMKDPSDMLMAGDTKEKELYQSCVFNAKVDRQGQVVDVKDIIENAMTKPVMGISFPWPTVTKACFGLRPHTSHVVGAAPKVGKTDHQHQLVHHLVYNEKVKVGMFDLENSPVKTAKKLASKEMKLDVTRPDIVYEDSILRSTLEGLDGKVRFYDRSGSRDWDDIRIAITEMHLLDDINIFIIDPITSLVSRFSSSEANDELNRIFTDVADLVALYPITIFFYSHVNPKPKSSTPHERGARVYSSEFSGSRALEKWTHYGHGISRDRTDECPEELKNVSDLYMLYDRDFGQTYTTQLYFDEPTVTYLEVKKGWT